MKNRYQSAFDWDEFGKYMKKQFPMIADHSWLDIVEHNNKVPEPKINWDKFGEYMKEQFPMITDPSWIGNVNPFAASGIHYEMFESHRCVFVKCQISAGTSIHDIKFLINKRKLKIEHSGKSKNILLPCDVNPNRSTAKIKDGVLEIRMIKSQEKEHFREIHIRH